MSETINKSHSLHQTRLILIDSRAGQSEDWPRPQPDMQGQPDGLHVNAGSRLLLIWVFNLLILILHRFFRSMPQMKAYIFLNLNNLLPSNSQMMIDRQDNWHTTYIMTDRNTDRTVKPTIPPTTDDWPVTTRTDVGLWPTDRTLSKKDLLPEWLTEHDGVIDRLTD